LDTRPADREEIPVVLKTQDLILWTLGHTARFPRILPKNSFEYQAERVQEIGKMVGGWRKAAAKTESREPERSFR
jgi:hypothetical protein